MVTKGQLPVTAGRIVLHCRVCGDNSSATRGDYFQLPDTHVMKCCKQPMILAVKRVVYDEVFPTLKK